MDLSKAAPFSKNSAKIKKKRHKIAEKNPVKSSLRTAKVRQGVYNMQSTSDTIVRLIIW
jgi:hypothetical protein